MAKKYYESALLIIIILIATGLICIGIWSLKKIPLLPISSLVISSILSFFLLKNKDFFNGKIKTDIIIFSVSLISIACAFIMFLESNKQTAYLSKLLIDGSFKSERIDIPNGEIGDDYKTEYSFTPKTKSGKTAMSIIGIIVILSCLLIPWYNLNAWQKAQKQNGTYTGRE